MTPRTHHYHPTGRTRPTPQCPQLKKTLWCHQSRDTKVLAHQFQLEMLSNRSDHRRHHRRRQDVHLCHQQSRHHRHLHPQQ